MSEEEKAFRRLEEMKNNYSLNGKDLHYANLLYYLIINLHKKNQQLKEKLKLVESLASFNMPNNTPMVCMFKADYERNKYEYETLDKYKSVLDEIREYIETHVKEHIHDDYDVTLYNSLNQGECDELLQILDKVKE